MPSQIRRPKKERSSSFSSFNRSVLFAGVAGAGIAGAGIAGAGIAGVGVVVGGCDASWDIAPTTVGRGQRPVGHTNDTPNTTHVPAYNDPGEHTSVHTNGEADGGNTPRTEGQCRRRRGGRHSKVHVTSDSERVRQSH